MQRKLFLIIFFLPFLLAADEEVACEYDHQYVDGKCVDRCEVNEVCGNFTSCETIGAATYCKCLRGYSGDPLDSCFKLGEEKPCEPNICGEHSACIENNEEIGPHCKCLENFYGWPPNCRAGCKDNDECEPTEICSRDNYCVNLCLEHTCGGNSSCRVDKKELKIHCSCNESFTPKRGIGCELKSDDVPLDFISEVTTDKCDGKCSDKAYCDDSGECVCTQGYEGNATASCTLIEFESRIDACQPNPCGGLSTCSVVDDEKANCSCIEGFGTAPYCYRCYSTTGCGLNQLCVGGRCVANICEPFCGQGAGCNINNGTLECFCEANAVNLLNEPFLNCVQLAYIPSNVIATLLG